MGSYDMKRPKRLSEETRALAERAKRGEFGKEMAAHYCAYVDEAGYADMSVRQQYNACVKAIVEQDVIRLTDGEWLAGSASFDKARNHVMPVSLDKNDPDATVFGSDSHLTPHYYKVVKKGIRAIEREIEESICAHKGDEDALEFLQQMQITVGYLKQWHQRYLAAIDEKILNTEGVVRIRWEEVRKNLTNVPLEPAQNFREAIQSLWFIFVFLRALGNWPAVGRIDWMLGSYLKKDLESGAITLDEAREYIAHFWIKGCEWVALETNRGNRAGSGDGQNYQNIVLGGQDADGNDTSNEITYLVLDVIEELGIADYPTSVRISKNTPEKLMRRVAEVLRYGGGALAVYNDDIVIPALIEFGYSKEEACLFANDGCWEVQIPGKTKFDYWPWDVLSVFQNETLRMGDAGASQLPYEDFDALFQAYMKDLYKDFVWYLDKERDNNPARVNLAMAMLVEDCIGRAKDFAMNGADYRVFAPHAGGLPDVANAMQAIYHVVYEKKMMSLDAFVDILKANWEGQEELRYYLRNELVYYGNGDSEGDAMMQRLFSAYVNMIGTKKEHKGYLFPAGISTFGRQITEEFLDRRHANADGHFRGEYLANNIDPTPGTDVSGSTALLRSYGSLDMLHLPGGTALDMRLSSATVRGEDGLEGLVDLLYAFCELGCYFLQPDIVDTEVLREAQKNPEAYSNLTVRVSGWSARFQTLSKEWQNMVISRTEAGY